MVDIENLPTAADGSADFSGIDPDKAMAMLQDAVIEAPEADVQQIVAALTAAGEQYKAHARQRRYVLDVLKGLGTAATVAKGLLA